MAAVQLTSILSAFAAGARFGRFASAAFESPLGLLHIPAAVVVALGLIPPVAAIIFAATVRYREDAVYAGLGILATAVFFGLVPWGLAIWYPTPGGVAYDNAPSGWGLGWHWLAAPVQSITVVALIFALIRGLGRAPAGRRIPMRIDVEVRENPSVFLDIPMSFPHSRWQTAREWASSAAQHASQHSPDIRRSARVWRSEARIVAATKLRDSGAAALFWAFGRETDPPTIVQLVVGERVDPRSIADVAVAGADDGTGEPGEDTMSGEIDSTAHGRVAFATAIGVHTVGRRTLRFPTYWVVAEPVDGVLIMAQHRILGTAVDATLLEQMIALVESTRVETIPIEEAP